jgi:hypothetical protein
VTEASYRLLPTSEYRGLTISATSAKYGSYRMHVHGLQTTDPDIMILMGFPGDVTRDRQLELVTAAASDKHCVLVLNLELEQLDDETLGRFITEFRTRPDTEALFIEVGVGTP